MKRWQKIVGITALVVIVALVVLSFVLGYLMANTARMRDYGWKIGLILSTVTVSTFVVLFGDFKLASISKGA